VKIGLQIPSLTWPGGAKEIEIIAGEIIPAVAAF